MKKNMGTADRIIRVIIAAIFVIMYATGVVDGIFGVVLVALGVIFTLTSVVGFCPLYAPFGISTLRKKLIPKKP